MSRFFTTGSDSESQSSESDEDIQQKPAPATKTFQLSDDEEETKRVVRSSKDKRFEELQSIIKTLRNHKKIKDMSSMCDDFEVLVRAFDKANKLADKGDPKDWPPQFFIRCLVEVDDFVNECWADQEGRKALSKNNAKGLTTLKQKSKKYIRDYKFEAKLVEYKQKRSEGQLNDEEEEQEQRDQDESGESDDGDDSDVDVIAAPKEDKKSAKKNEDSDSDSDDMWERSSESESSSSDDEARPISTLTAEFFRKKTPADGEETKKKRDKEEKKVKKARPQKIESGSDDEDMAGGGWEQVKGGVNVAVMEKPKLFAKDEKIDHKKVDDKLRELVAGRGKKGTDRNRNIESLIELRQMAKDNNLGTAIDCKILFSVVAAIYDYNPNIAANMKSDMWEKCLVYIRELLELLTTNIETIIAREYVADETENERFTKPPPYHIRGCMLTVVERMDEEFLKMLQACDAHSTEYIVRLRDETAVCKIIEDLEKYLRLQGQVTDEELCRVYLKRIQHIYYKFEHKTEDSAKQADVEDGQTLMDRLCKFIYTKDSTDRIRTRAILCHIYHHALHDRWYEARDLMLMSHLQDNVQHSDIPTQILYNRAMVQLGICAFRQGLIKDAHSCLVDIQSSGRAKELLAQGLLLVRQHERTAEQEKIEKRRQMPYHMHINLELLECVYLVSAMLIEIPYMAAHEFDARRRMISKNFHHVLRVSERQPLVGPPESMREHVVAACKAMKIGDWVACSNFIINSKMNTKVWDLFYNANTVREMIKQKIQEESLRTYLFSYSSVYDSLSLDILSCMFELEKPVVHSVISKMIINEELMASLDEPTQAVVMHRTEPTRLQSLALQLAEKMASLVDQNERMLEMKTSGPGFFNYNRQGQQNYQQQQQGGGGGGGYGGRQRGGGRGGRDGGNNRYQQY